MQKMWLAVFLFSGMAHKFVNLKMKVTASQKATQRFKVFQRVPMICSIISLLGAPMVATTFQQGNGKAVEVISFEKIWRQADLLMLFLVWVMFTITCVVGWMMDSLMLALIVGGTLALASTLLRALLPGSLATRLWFAFNLIAFSALMIQLG